MESGDQKETEVSLSTRSPFKNLHSDSPMANKKRKSRSSPDCRTAKQAKITSKENEDDLDLIEEICSEETDKTDLKKSDNAKNVSKSNTPNNSKSKTTTPNKGKNKKPEKVQTNLLTKFLKKVDKTSENQSIHLSDEKDDLASTSDKGNAKTDEKNKSMKGNLQIVKVVIEKMNQEQILENIEKKNENKNDESTSEKEEPSENFDIVEPSCSLKTNDNNQEDDLDEDSDVCSSVSEDSSRLNNDNKRTEHEDTDSRDDLSRPKQRTPKIKLNTTTPAKKITPKQIEKKLESQKKREQREKQRLVRSYDFKK